MIHLSSPRPEAFPARLVGSGASSPCPALPLNTPNPLTHSALPTRSTTLLRPRARTRRHNLTMRPHAHARPRFLLRHAFSFRSARATLNFTINKEQSFGVQFSSTRLCRSTRSFFSRNLRLPPDVRLAHRTGSALVAHSTATEGSYCVAQHLIFAFAISTLALCQGLSELGDPRTPILPVFQTHYVRPLTYRASSKVKRKLAEIKELSLIGQHEMAKKQGAANSHRQLQLLRVT